MAGYIGSKTVSLSTTAANVDGNITVTGNVDGRDVSVDGTKLDTIPVISTSSVPSFTAKSDGTTDGHIQLNCSANTHGIKLKSPPHSAGASYTLVFPTTAGTSGQFLKTDGSGNLSWGTDATLDNTKLPLAGGAMTGAITTNSTFDGRNVSSDGTKLDGIETAATADQTDAQIKTAVQNSSDIALAGNPTTTTQSASNNSTRIATTAYTDAAITALVNSAPATLDTLNELANALGDDPNYAATTTTLIGTKLPKAGGTMTGNLIVNAASANIDVSDTGTSFASQDFLTNSNAARTTIGVERSAGGGLFVGSSAYASVFGSAGAHSTQIASNNNVRMTIDTSGNVGIGTTAPDQKLHIKDGTSSGAVMRLERTDTSMGNNDVYGGIEFEGNDTDTNANGIRGFIRGLGQGTGGGMKMEFGTAGGGVAIGAARMTLNADGNLGIGTSNPVAKLAIKGANDTNFEIQPDVSSGVNRITNFNRVTSAYKTFRLDALEHQFYISGNPKVTINSTGQVSAASFLSTDFIDIRNDDAEIYFSNAANNRYARIRRDNTHNDLVMAFYNGSGTSNKFQFRASGDLHVNDGDLIVASGDVGIGTDTNNDSTGSTTILQLQKTLNDSDLALRIQNNATGASTTGSIRFNNTTSTYDHATIKGGRSPSSLQVLTTNNTLDNVLFNDSGATFNGQGSSILDFRVKSNNNDSAFFVDAGTEVVMINTDNNSTTTNAGHKWHMSATQTTQYVVINANVGTNYPFGIYNQHGTFNGTRFKLQINGGLANFSANNVNLSDQRMKENITLLADGALAKICAIPVKTFNYKDEPNGTDVNIGVIAQDVEAVAPELVDHEWGRDNDGVMADPFGDGVPLKSVFSDDIQYTMMKAIQELKTALDVATARITALEA